MSQKGKISTSTIFDTASLEIEGAFNMSYVEITEIVKNFVAKGNSDIIIDLRKTDFLTSEGLAAMIIALKYIRSAGGRMFLFGPTSDMISIFNLTLLDRVFIIAEDENSLRKKLKEHK